MFCIQCGTKLLESTGCCPQCSSQRKRESSVNVAPSAVTAEKPGVQPSGEPTTSESKWSALGILSALAGAGIGRYCGLNMLVPLAGAAAVWAIGSRVAAERTRPLLPAISVQSGHVVWFLVGLIALGDGGLHAMWFDVSLMVTGLIWLYLRPGLGPVALLTAWQLFALLTNLEAFLDATVGTMAHKALLVHMMLRIAAIYLMFAGLRMLRRSAPDKPESGSQANNLRAAWN